MPSIDKALQTELEGIVGTDRIRTDERECGMYSTDIGVMPPLVRPFVKAGRAGAVMRPHDEAEVAAIVRACSKAGVPLVPRGASTSGYGGVLPHKGAVVVDLSGLDQVLSVDCEHLEVTTQAGAIWEEIDRRIARDGLECRLHPSSYPSSTVAGWLAQGGSGFGSYEFGSFEDSVVSARVIGADGEARDFSGEQMHDLIASAEGTTGIITQVTFRVRKLEPQTVRLVAFPTLQDISGALLELQAAKVPLWSLTFLNPTSVALKRKLPIRACHAYELDDAKAEAAAEENLPDAYLALIAYPTSRDFDVADPLASIANGHNGTFLSDPDARREWENRTAPMRLKRIGPSIIPTEVVVPLDQLSAVLAEIDTKIHQPFVLEGMLGSDGRVVLLGYIPHDERRFAFNPAFALSLSVIKIANTHGGSCYSTGLYFRREARQVLGEAKVKALREYRLAHDPHGILNPGKVIAMPGQGGGALDRLMGFASACEPAIRPIANAAKPPQRLDDQATWHEDFSGQKHGIPADVAYMALTCARCGYCVHTCEQYSGRGWESQSPRGKYAMLRDIVAGRDKWDRAGTDTMLSCTTCEVCETRCQLQLPVEKNGMALRNKLVEEQGMGTFPPFEMMAASFNDEGDIWAGKRKHRADWLPEDVKAKLPQKADILYFAGCTASYVENDIAEATLRLLQDAGLDVTYLGTEESCCAIPMKMAGHEDLFEKAYEDNTAAARAHGAKTIVTSCPACALVWKEYYAEVAKRRGEPYEFEVKQYSELIAPAIADGRLKLTRDVRDILGKARVTFHDSCHAGRAQGIYEPPREMLAAIPGIDLVEMEHNREEGLCCGSVVTLVGEMPVAPVLGKNRLDEAVDIDAGTVVALCPCCQVQLRDSAAKCGCDVAVDDLARVVACAAGYDIPKSEANTTYMWGFFERFITLMEPSNMAAFMARIFPQMLDAMPAHMGGMMRRMAKMPGGPALMTRMMPAMFPKMAPGILTKVMPDLVAEVGAYIGKMPPDMEELMPGLLPKTMDALMPTYIPELIPYLVPLFVGYLKGDDTTGTTDASTSVAA